MAKTTKRGFFLPELVEKAGRAWTVKEVEIRDAKVNTATAEAEVPRPITPAQQLARLHELGHVKYSPGPTKAMGWTERRVRVMEQVGERADPRACLRLLKMLEENRIDWLLWDKHNIDLRPAREVLDWAQMPDPDSLLDAVGTVLQLAWTVWASRGLGKGIPNEPPARVPDPDTGECFDKAWKVVTDADMELARAVIRACLKMYSDPTDEMRDRCAAELAEFFLLDEEEEEKQPPVKQAERERQQEAEQEETEREQTIEKEESGVGADTQTHDGVQYHDHTANVRRPSVRIVRKSVPVTQGIAFRYAHRYLTDKAIFSQRMLTEGGIMIDGSGSMHWTQDDMIVLMNRLPAVTIGVYSSVSGQRDGSRGRICTLAKRGRFCSFTGLDPEMDGGNAVDLEALKLLARWPQPRLWLSDGMVCGGNHTGPCGHAGHDVGYYHYNGKVHEACDQVMRAYGILRVPDRDTMLKLLKRDRVTLYRTSTPGEDSQYQGENYWPADVRPQPVVFTL